MRLIDADNAIEKADAYFDCKDAKKKMERMVREMTIYAEPPNEPLTLNELREMDGEPIWIVGVSCINNFKGHWDICDWENEERLTFPYCMEEPNLEDYDPEKRLGIAGWRAYRRKPEGEN